MRTATEMFDYCKTLGLFSSSDRNWSLNLFSVIENKLTEEEKVSVCFIGIRNKQFQTKSDGFFAYALTNKRFIIGQKKIFRDYTQVIGLNNIESINVTTGVTNSVLIIDTLDRSIEIVLPTQDIEKIHTTFKQHLTTEKLAIETQNKIPSAELRELKELFDQGILTKEEFTKAKVKLLDL